MYKEDFINLFNNIRDIIGYSGGDFNDYVLEDIESGEYDSVCIYQNNRFSINYNIGLDNVEKGSIFIEISKGCIVDIEFLELLGRLYDLIDRWNRRGY